MIWATTSGGYRTGSPETHRGWASAVTLRDQEQGQSSGGLLDLIAVDEDSGTYYSIEVQLGEIDASHSFRVFDYWARNRARLPGQTHVAVLVVENAGGRFRLALEALAETVPLVVIELRCWSGEREALLIPEVVVSNASLDLSETPAAATVEERTEADWREEASDEAWRFKDEFVGWVEANLGPVRVDYKPKSYIGVRVGRRTWAPLCGAAVYLPDPDGSRSEVPSHAFEEFEARLSDEGLTASWQPSYNAKANPVSIRLRREDLGRGVVQDLLRASYSDRVLEEAPLLLVGHFCELRSQPGAYGLDNRVLERFDIGVLGGVDVDGVGQLVDRRSLCGVEVALAAGLVDELNDEPASPRRWVLKGLAGATAVLGGIPCAAPLVRLGSEWAQASF